MESPEKRIIKACLERYGGNLAGILIFGSYNTGQYDHRISDIDTIILLNKKEGLDLQKEQTSLREELSELNLSIQHFDTIKDYEEHIYKKGSWSSWITVICGSKIIYSAPKFKNFRKRLSKKPISNEKLIEYIQYKDKFELEGYFKQRGGYDITKALFSHLRRKLQMLSFYQGNKLNFDYSICLNNLKDLKYKKELIEISELYKKRGVLKKSEILGYVKIAKDLTEKIIKLLKKSKAINPKFILD
ncbi:MAG TPA: nucleotidyltransferase domain-containing protein [Candidatus Nanoarchaeia archaeon]|nr:nucleotidyltransferase domain-containing protein [Candidatus Nanoarchaeia archaeon]